MQQKIKGKEKEGKTEEGLVIERRFIRWRRSFESSIGLKWMQKYGIPMVQSADSITGVKLPSGYPESPKVLAQKYLRKAGVPAHLRKVAEEGVPVWLQRSEPDHEKLTPKLKRGSLEREMEERFSED